jgi:predicted phage-related endonuclease
VLIQGTPEWFAARLGKATGSRMADVVTKIKSGAYSASRAKYATEVLCERLTGVPLDTYCSRDMQWGKDQEGPARATYSRRTGQEVFQIGFVDHPEISRAGCSPDGLINDDGMIQIKCPTTPTHIATLESMEVPPEYLPQIQWEMACTGRLWSDFISFDPRLPPDLDMIIIRVDRDDSYILGLESEVTGFLDDLTNREAFLRASIVKAPVREEAEVS